MKVKVHFRTSRGNKNFRNNKNFNDSKNSKDNRHRGSNWSDINRYNLVVLK